jgi:mercuric ion binding protein
MQTLKFFALGLFLLSLSIKLSAQHNHAAMGGGSNSNMNMNQDTHANMMQIKTETLKVSGKCQMCKSRIEKIAGEYGAASADWDVKSQLLTIVFDPSVTSVDNICYKLLKAGHDSGGIRTKDKAYNSLPECCKYDRISLK